MRRVFLLYCLLTLASQALCQQISYVGNMGVLIECETIGILIDGLHKKYKAAYQYPPETLVAELIGKDEPYQPPIHLLLNTHIHKDHFDAELVLEFLKENAKAKLLGPAQTANAVLALYTSHELKQRIHEVKTTDYTIQNFSLHGIQVKAFFVDHANPARHSATKNVGFLIELDGKQILHLGDAAMDASIFSQLNLQAEEIDLAIIPDWLAMSKSGANIIKTYIAAKQLLITHISPLNAAESQQAVRALFPKAIFFTDLEQSFSF